MMKTKHGFQYTNGTHAFTLDWLNPSVVYLLTTYYLDPQQRDGF